MEREIKILVDEAGLARIARLPALQEAGLEARTLRSIYYDTPDRILSRHGVALRVRRVGRRWIQTVKRRTGEIVAGLSMPEELEFAVPRPEPVLVRREKDALLDHVRDLLGGALPAPVFETRIRRRKADLAGPAGIVEIALDEGEIVAGERSLPLREVEIELKAGGLGALYDAARMLFPEGPLRFSTLDKAAWGFLLADGGDEAPPAPRFAAPPAIDPAATVETAIRDVLRDCLAQIATNMVVVAESDAVEGPHQLRVGLRRLRTALGLFSAELGPAARPLTDAARDLGAEMGRLRDLDVLTGDLAAGILDAMGEPVARDALLEALSSRREAVRARIRARLRMPASVGLVLDLAEFVETRGWLDPEDWGQSARLARPIGARAPEILEKRYARVRSRGRHVARLSIEARHDLRKELKKLRYAVEFLGDAAGGAPKRFGKRLKTLQDGFGALNDAAMAGELLSGPEGPGAGDPAASRAAGFVLGVLSVRVEAELERFGALWTAFRRETPFWTRPD